MVGVAGPLSSGSLPHQCLVAPEGSNKGGTIAHIAGCGITNCKLQVCVCVCWYGVCGAFVACQVLSGCVVYDGSEVHVVSATMVYLSNEKTDVKMFAPDKQQMHVVNHTTEQGLNESRCM